MVRILSGGDLYRGGLRFYDFGRKSETWIFNGKKQCITDAGNQTRRP